VEWVKVRINLLHEPSMRRAFHSVANPARAAEYFSRLADRDANAISSRAFLKCRKISSALRSRSWCQSSPQIPDPQCRRAGAHAPYNCSKSECHRPFAAWFLSHNPGCTLLNTAIQASCSTLSFSTTDLTKLSSIAWGCHVRIGCAAPALWPNAAKPRRGRDL